MNLGHPQLGIEWPVPLAQAELSDKDRAHPALDDVAPLAPAPVLVLGARGRLGLALTARLSTTGVPFTAWTREELDLADPASWPAEISSAYTTDHPVAPLSVYGQSKAAGETAVRACPRHYVIRTSWVIGEGKNFVATMARLAAQGGPSVVAHQHGRLTDAADLAAGVLHLVDSGAPYGTYHLTGSGEPCTWKQVARWVFEDLGHDPARVTPVSTAEYNGGTNDGAPRPVNRVLDLCSILDAGFTPADSRAVALEEAAAFDGRRSAHDGCSPRD